MFKRLFYLGNQILWPDGRVHNGLIFIKKWLKQRNIFRGSFTGRHFDISKKATVRRRRIFWTGIRRSTTWCPGWINWIARGRWSQTLLNFGWHFRWCVWKFAIHGCKVVSHRRSKKSYKFKNCLQVPAIIIKKKTYLMKVNWVPFYYLK